MNEQGKEKNVVILNVTPQTHVRVTQGDKIFFRIPKDKLRATGLRRLQRIEKYNRYKIAILAEAKRNNFLFPDLGAAVTFYVPMPRTWRKPKRKLLDGKPHMNRNDIDNLTKALLDSLLKEDKTVAHIGPLAKYWVDLPIGWIEIVVNEVQPKQVVVPECVYERLRGIQGGEIV